MTPPTRAPRDGVPHRHIPDVLTSQPSWTRSIPLCGWPHSRICCLCGRGIPTNRMYDGWEAAPADTHTLCPDCLRLPDLVIMAGLWSSLVCVEVL